MTEQTTRLNAREFVVSQSALGLAARSEARGKMCQEPILVGGLS